MRCFPLRDIIVSRYKASHHCTAKHSTGQRMYYSSTKTFSTLVSCTTFCSTPAPLGCEAAFEAMPAPAEKGERECIGRLSGRPTYPDESQVFRVRIRMKEHFFPMKEVRKKKDTRVGTFTGCTAASGVSRPSVSNACKYTTVRTAVCCTC